MTLLNSFLGLCQLVGVDINNGLLFYFSRKVFKQREAFERMINENEDRTTKVTKI